MSRIYCPAACDGALAIDGLPVHLWINGAPLRDGPAIHPVVLRQGWNTLIAQPAVTEQDAADLSLPRIGSYIRLFGEKTIHE